MSGECAALVAFHCILDENLQEITEEYAATTTSPQPKHYLYNNLSVSICLVRIRIVLSRTNIKDFHDKNRFEFNQLMTWREIFGLEIVSKNHRVSNPLHQTFLCPCKRNSRASFPSNNLKYFVNFLTQPRCEKWELA